MGLARDGCALDYQERILHQHVEQVVEVHVPMTQDPFGAIWALRVWQLLGLGT